LRPFHRIWSAVKRFWKLADSSGLTGNAAMVAYNMLIGVIPVALLSLFVAGQVLASETVERSVLGDLREVFPGTTEHTLNQLLGQIKSSTATTGVLALIASLWLAGSFWGALDTSFSRIYGCPSRRWLEQKRFGLAMVLVVLLFMIATVSAAVRLPRDHLRAGAEPTHPVASGVAGGAERRGRCPGRQLRVPGLSDTYLDDRSVRDDDRVRADRARVVLPARGHPPRRGGGQCTPAAAGDRAAVARGSHAGRGLGPGCGARARR
jgi:hypothetical protein